MVFQQEQCRRCGAPKPNGAQSSPAAAAQVPRRNRKRGARPTQKPSAPPEYNLAKVLDGLKENGKLTSSPNAKPELPRLRSKQLSRPSQIARPRWPSRRPRSPSWKRQPRKQPRQWRRPSRRRRNCKGKSTSYRKSTTRSWLALPSLQIQSPIYRATCVRRSRPFLGIPKPSLSLLSWNLLSQAFPACWRLRRNPHGDRGARRRGIAAGQREGHLARGVGRCQSFRALAAGPARGRARGQESKDGGVRRASEASLAISNATSTQSTVRVAFMWPQARDRTSNPSPRSWSGKDSQFESPISRHHGHLPRQTSLRGNLDS